ncbi:MAG TPA: phosphoribosyltransferase family protein [Candidatus Saccharimonadaceae bacterium]|nr:phosphoribosyltransferase family protein [Candidatus Saccharimonadaceae bacterium]
MYFASRMQAGRMLAAQLMQKYRYENCAVVCLSDGGVMVGAQIAVQLHTILTMLLTAEIDLPREPEPIGGVSQEGSFAYNNFYFPGEIDELTAEYYQYIEQEKLVKIQEMQRLLGAGGMIRRDLLRGHNIIVVSDGLKSAFTLEVAMQYFKPVAMKKLIVATPLASVSAVDRMHILADELYCLNVVENYIDTDHYYDTQDIPSHEKVIETLEKIILNWK